MSVIDAVLARLQVAVDPVYDGLVPVDDQGRPLAQRYAVLYASAGARSAEGLCRTADRYTFRWQLTSVGLTRTQADWVARHCRDALLDRRIVVEGWQLGPVEHKDSNPIYRDDDIPGLPLFTAADFYSLTAAR